MAHEARPPGVRTDIRPIGPRALMPAILVAAIAGGIVRADVVQTKGRRSSVGVRITALRDGQLDYRLATGREVTRSIGEIEYLQVTGWPLFNLAEKQRRDGHLRQAAASYERLLAKLAEPGSEGGRPQAGAPPVAEARRDARRPGAEHLDRRLLVQCRLLGAYAGQGRFDRAVVVYLDVIERMPAALETLRPVELPAAGSTFLRSARTHIDAAIERHGHDPIAVSLARWRDTWPGDRRENGRMTSSGPVPAGVDPRDAAASRPADWAVARRVKERLAEIQSRIEAGRFDDALRIIEPLLDASAGPGSADLYYWQARALLGRAADRDSPEARQDRRRAGLALMRVVIQFPGHARAPECLFQAGEICRQSGQLDPARRLWSELLGSYPAAAPWTDRARQGLTDLPAPDRG